MTGCGKSSWKTKKSEYLIDSKWLKVRKDHVLLPNGVELDDYFVIEKKDVALVVAMNDREEIILKKEYRYPMDEVLTELPGGTIEAVEDSPLEAAKRELLEETGYSSRDWQLLLESYDFPTKESNKVFVFLAQNVEKTGEQILDISEEIEYMFVPMEEAVRMCMDNEIKVNGSIAGILKAARRNKR